MQSIDDDLTGLPQCNTVLIEILHGRQDEIGLRLAQLAHVKGDHLSALVREDREGEYRRIDPEPAGNVERFLLTDQQRIADLELLRK